MVDSSSGWQLMAGGTSQYMSCVNIICLRSALKVARQTQYYLDCHLFACLLA